MQKILEEDITKILYICLNEEPAVSDIREIYEVTYHVKEQKDIQVFVATSDLKV